MTGAGGEASTMIINVLVLPTQPSGDVSVTVIGRPGPATGVGNLRRISSSLGPPPSTLTNSPVPGMPHANVDPGLTDGSTWKRSVLELAQTEYVRGVVPMGVSIGLSL